MKVIVTRKIPGPGIDLLQQQGYEVVVNPNDRVLETAELKEFVHGADGILSLLTDKITSEVIEAAGPQLKIVANYAVGYDNIDVAAARAKNVFVTNTPGGFEFSVAEHAVALMLAVARKIIPADAYVRAEKYVQWEPELFMGMELYGKTLGIVGMGRIGSALAKICEQGLGMKIVSCSHGVGNLADVLTQADVVSLHVPLNDGTRHMISKKELSGMKKNAILINTARGAVIDELALCEALQNKWIAGAGLDVFEDETKIISPSEKILYTLPNVVLTPHIASATVEARAQMSQAAAQNIIMAFNGQTPKNLVS